MLILLLLIPIIYSKKDLIFWNYIKYSSKVTEYFYPKNIGIKIDLVTELESQIKLEFILNNNKLILNDNFENVLVNYRINESKFRVILNKENIKHFEFIDSNIDPRIILNAIDQNNKDISDILDEYSGPKRNFYNHIIKMEIKDILKDSELKDSKIINIIDNDVSEFKINLDEMKYLKINK
jgi:hypothetical protein